MNFKLSKYLYYLIFITISVGLISCDDDEDGDVGPVEEPVSIAETIAESPDFTILAEALNKAGLEDMFSGDSTYTVLAPPDDAFINAGITSVDDYSPAELQAMLQYHVFDQSLAYADLDTGSVATLNGPVNFSFFADRFFINGEAEFLQIDVEATNGLIHVIDEVLFPPEKPITTLISEEENLKTLQAVLQRTGLASTLTGAGPYTLFAPTDLAFEILLEDLNVASIDEISTAQLTNILEYHVVNGQEFSTELPFTDVETITGNEFSVTFTDRIVVVDQNPDNENAVIVRDNLLGTNGLVHKIDRVLLPE